MKTYRTSQVAAAVGVHPNTVRLYEELQMIPKPERQANGYRIYSEEDVRRLKIIRTLRGANYSLESILRLLGQLDQNPVTDIRAVLNTPRGSEDIVSVCDHLIASLTEAEENAGQMLSILLDMENRFA